MTEILSCSARPDRRLVPTGGGSLRHVLVEVRANGLPRKRAKEPEPLNLALVVDRSGSMSGLPLVFARHAAEGVVRLLGPADRLSIVGFDSEVIVPLPSRAMDEAGREAALAAIATLEARGTTNLAAGWLAGAELVAADQLARPGSRSHVIVLSDGHANQGIVDPAVLVVHADELRRRSVLTSAVGIGDGYSPVQLHAIAERGGGRLHDAERPEEIAEVVMAELQEVRETAAEDLVVRLSAPQGVEIECIGFEGTTGPEGLSVPIGALVEGRSRRVAFRVRAPAGLDGTGIPLRVRAGGRLADGRTTEAPDAVALLVVAEESLVAGCPVDEEVVAEVARIWQAQLVRDAAARNHEGDLRGACEALERQGEAFGAYCAEAPGLEVLASEVRMLKASVARPMARRAAKEIHLASYKRVKGDRDLRRVARPQWTEFLEDREERTR